MDGYIYITTKKAAGLHGVPDAMRSLGMHPWLWEYRVFVGEYPFLCYTSPNKMPMVVDAKGGVLNLKIYKKK